MPYPQLPQDIIDACDAAIVAANNASPGKLNYGDGIRIILDVALPMRDEQIRAESAERIAHLEKLVAMHKNFADAAQAGRDRFIEQHARNGAEQRETLKRVAAVATTRRKTVAVADLRIALGWDHPVPPDDATPTA